MMFEKEVKDKRFGTEAGRGGHPSKTTFLPTKTTKLMIWESRVYMGDFNSNTYNYQALEMDIKVALLLLLLVFTHAQTVVKAPLNIIYVSSDPGTIVRPIYSSLRGGRMIYIKASGHSPDPSDNLVYVGTYPCIVPSDGVTDTFISCETTDSGSDVNSGALSVTLISYGSAVTKGYPDAVYYRDSGYTPQLRDIFPSAGFAGYNVNLYGVHSISDLGDGLRFMGNVTRIRLGQDMCSRFDVEQSAISATGNAYIRCIESSLQEAGKYNVTEQVTPGFANHNPLMRRSSFDPKEYFEFTSLPTVGSVSPANGNIGGQYLTISGTGFSLNPSNNSVWVDGNDCKVTAASSNQLKCTVAKKDAAKTSLLSSNASSQVSGYFSGAGLTYSRYTMTSAIDTMNEFVTAVRGSNSSALGTPQETGFRADLREGNVYEGDYAQTWTGYFTAPATGTYKFKGTADDYFALYINSDYGSKASPASPLIYSNTYQSMFQFYQNYIPTAEASVSMEAGKSYYLEAYQIDVGGTGFVDIAVEVPNSEPSASFTAYQIDKITTNSTIQPEVKVFTMTVATTGILELRVYRQITATSAYEKRVNITYGCQASTFESALNSFDGYYQMKATVVRNCYDGAGNVLANTTGAVKIEYVASIYKLRSASLQAEKFTFIKYNGYDGTFTETQTQTHSPLISGTFTLTIGGADVKISNSANLPYNVAAADLQTAIRAAAAELVKVEVTQTTDSDCSYSCTWLIKYKGVTTSIPTPTVSAAMLSGGATSPTIVASSQRPYSINLQFDPIDYRFLHTSSNSINVLVQTNGIPAICTGSATYSFNTYTEIQTLTYSGTGTTLSMSLSDPTSANFPINTITVTVGDKPCTVDGGSTLSALTCQMATNTDGTPILVAGSVTPVVSVGTYGIAGLASGVNPLAVSLVATSLSVTTGGNNGGYLITLAGKGFPLDQNQINITICGNRATIRTITNIRADFYVPACANIGVETVTIQMGASQDTSLSFTYSDASGSAPTITSLVPASANPGIKGTIEIFGNSFGLDASIVKVFLSNATGKVYQLNIFKLNNTYIKAGLPGGLPGVFTVQVNLASSLGDSIAAAPGTNTFTYVFSVSSISPTSGSIYGGTLLTITGENFSTDTQNTLVYVGDTLNWFCAIESITTTQIKCRTPAISRFYAIGVPVNVVVSTRLLILNSCTGACQFTYLTTSASPALTSSSSSSFSLAGSSTKTITLTGTNLLDAGNQAEVALTNTVTLVTTVFTAGSLSATSLTFTVTASLPSGNYEVRVRNAVGATNALSLAVGWSPGTASWNQGGSVKGGIVTVSNGGGYPSSIDGKAFAVTLTVGTVSYPFTIVSCCSSNTLSLQIPAAPTGTTFTITFTGPTGSSTKTYSVLTSLTPTASITTSMPVSVGANTITFSATSTLTVTIKSISLVSTIDNTQAIVVSNSNWLTNGTGATAVTVFNATLYTGSYSLNVNTDYGYVDFGSLVNVSFPVSVITNTQQMSFNGGSFTVQANYVSPASYITLNGLKGSIISRTDSEVVYTVPPLLTTATQTAFSIGKVTLIDNKMFTPISDTDPATTNVKLAFDGLTTTNYGSTNAQCYLGVDAGSGVKVSANRFRFFPNLMWTNVGKIILQAEFQGSDDLSSWTTLAIVDQTVHTGWNVIKSNSSTPYRYLRFKHNSTSNCSIAEFQVYGILYSTTSATLSSTPTDVILVDGFNTKTFSAGVDYQQTKTPIVNSVSPRYGDVAGGYTLTLTGVYLDAGTASIKIDGVDCPVASATATTVVCNVAARLTTPTIDNTFTVSIGPSSAILKDIFLYVLKWSSAATWGVDTPPVDYDLVYVPKGTTLLVDQDTPILEGIAVEGGRLVFSDDMDLKVQAGHITMNGGHFIAGTATHPHTHKLEFVMYGGYYGKQMPMFGNKGIGCMNCKFEMYGTPRPVTWSKITATINVGDSQLTVADTVDWAVGEEIVVASTSFVHQEAEVRKITAINGSTITVNATFQYKHVSVVEDYSGDKLAMQAEVGLLTRNIKMHGESESEMKQYGSHLMLSGNSVNGFEGYVGYTEFYHCGQPQILGRYCIHFHMIGDIPDSFARGNAVHDSFARIVTIHGVHYLTVEDNVGYRVKGHNVFVEDGIETHNLIKHNLVISSLQTTRMLQTDTSVASFWVTNPTNDFIGNVAAGSDFYGIWYELKEHPDGPSATNDVCPMGNPLGTVSNNIAHSNLRFGLRIFILASRLYPCDPVRNNTDPNDPWSSNPSQPSVFQNFTIYKNLEDGVLSEETGNVIFDNFIIAENYHAGVEFYIANMTKEPPALINSVIIGMSTTNAHPNTSNYTNGMSAAITGRTGTYKLSNIKFHNFPAGSVLFQTCRFCDNLLKYTNLGTEVELDRLTFTNVSGKYLFMIGLKRDIVRDLDGSLSQAFDGLTRASGTVVHGFPHIAAYNNADCPPPSTGTDWDTSVMCGPSLTLRRVFIANLIDKQLFNAQLMKVVQFNSINDTLDPNATLSSTLYTAVTARLIQTNNMESKNQAYAYSLPYILGRIYNVWWGTGIEFTHLALVSDPNYLVTEPGIIFKFNYTENRELFQVGPMRGGVSKLTSLNFLKQSAGVIDPATCENGQYFHNNEAGPQRMVEICQSGRNRTKFEYTEVNGIVCRFNCPLPSGIFVLQDFVRRWSNATQWPNGVLPAAGDNVTVNGTWRLLIDIDTPAMNYLTIDGILMVDDTRDINITANSIHIRAGNLSAGTPGSPFLHKFTIQLNGAKTDNGYYVDPVVAGNKYMVVTGILNLYGPVPDTVNTYLTQPAGSGSSTIAVASSAGWAVGDELVISPSFRTFSQYERVTISALNADGTITLSAPLAYTHYGAGSITISNSIGQLDTRARVSHITRNVKVVPGPDAGWGFTVIVYGYMDATILRVGSTQLSGVLFDNGGQLDTLKAPLTFLNSKNGNYSSSVTKVAFTGCKASCIYVQNSENITITNNILYNAWNYAVQMTKIKKVLFNANTIIGVQSSPSLPEGAALVACMFVEEYLDPAFECSIQDNFCLGSSQHGFAFPHTKCTELESNPMAGNTAGATKIGFIFNTIGEQCQGFSYARAYANQIGQICGPPGIQTIVFDHFMMADNGRSVTLKLGANEGGNNHTAFLQNSFITALSRPACDFCYGPSATDCTNTIGVRMLTASANGEVMPAKYGTGFDVVCKQPVYDSKSYIVNTTFDNFRQSYSSQPNCNSNFMFTPNSGGFDQVASANLFNCPAPNSDTSSYLTAITPNNAFLGWFGGCGDIVCTGFQNYLVQDHTSDTFGFMGTIIPNNSVIAANEGCAFSASMNSYMCQNRSDFAVLQYQNVAADFKTRIMWPVNLKGDTLNYTTVTNGWREWEWLGSEPLNRRFGRFASIIRTGQSYNMTFMSEPPQKLQVMLQRRTPQGSLNSSVFRLHYPKPNSIRLRLGDTILDPILLTDVNNTASAPRENLNLSKCGSHIYFYTNYTISFVVTEEPTCIVQIELTESVQLTTHFSMDINDFFNSNSTITNFINNLCALLNIVDTSRVKVVGVISGSTTVIVSISDSSSTSPTEPSVALVSSSISTIISSGSYASAMSSIGLGTVLGASSVLYTLTDDVPSTEDGKKSNVGLIAGVTAAGVILLVGVVVAVVCCLRRRAKVVEEVMSHQDEVVGEKESIEKENHFMFGGSSEGPEVPNESEIKIKNNSKASNVLRVHELGENSEIMDN